MKYRIRYQRFSPLQQKPQLVEEVVQASGAELTDGCLSLLSYEGHVTHAFPVGVWIMCEPEDSSNEVTIVTQ